MASFEKIKKFVNEINANVIGDELIKMEYQYDRVYLIMDNPDYKEDDGSDQNIVLVIPLDK